MPDFIPTADTDLLAWANPFSAKLTATPTAYGVTAGNASTLAGLLTTFSTALAAATNPQTRGGSTIAAKDTARVNLVANIRQLARQIQGTITVTNQQRYDLGLTVRDTTPTPVPPPAFSPTIMIESTIGNTVRIRLVDSENPTRRGKPAGVRGASVFSFVGDEAPTTEAAWKFEGNTTRTIVDVTFPPATAPGSKVWFTAFWFNPRSQSGPPATAVGVNIPGGAAMAA